MKLSLRRISLALVAAALAHHAGAAPFTFAPFADPVVSASFSVNFAALNANRFAAGFELNFIRLVGASGAVVDLSDDIFGTSSFPDPPDIDLADNATAIFTAAVPGSFLTDIATGFVGYQILVTDTVDGFFAVDYFALDVTTTGGLFRSVIGNLAGDFGLGVPPNGTLPDGLFASLPPFSTGTGFDEAINSIALEAAVPEPSTLIFTALGLVALGLRRRLSSQLKVVALLALFTAGAAPSFAKKRVVCVSDDHSAFVNNNEGFQRVRAEADIKDKKVTGVDFVIGGEIADCLKKVADGDELIIIAHACGEAGGGLNWHTGTVLHQYDGFGKENGPPSPVPDGFNQRKNVAATIISCRSCKTPGVGDKRSSCKKLLDEMAANGGNTCFGFQAVANGFVSWRVASKPGKKATKEQLDAADRCLDFDFNKNGGNKSSWVNTPPVGRPGAEFTQLTIAQRIVDNCAGAGGNVAVTQVLYREPTETINGMKIGARDCATVKQQGQAQGVSPQAVCCDCECGLTAATAPGSPDKITVTCPATNPLAVGTEYTLISNVWAQDFPLPDQPVEFRSMLGGVQFLSGTISPDGSRSTVPTGFNGIATVQFKITRTGVIIIQAGIPGKTLAGVSFLTAK